ncbi:hypothetical protein BWD42_21990 [Sphingobacterium sp. CZ-UAM]|uniref:hypothetical protein n=1 Tax=Sphingobacterium sp. CZ-UAM TaxID=1933868 RepID=UPI000986DA9A|nr:hypothetical protein [Sphingobacterium sp. CZ-UAM]OOG16059.1 hypothetical protein BWD42_21990 [Sphingobacterium sp. CZ-UAM]
MKKIKLVAILLSLLPILSCVKNGSMDKLDSNLDQTKTSLKAANIPTTNGSQGLGGFIDNKQITLDEMKANIFYVSMGNMSKGNNDTSVNINLDKYSGANGVIKGDFQKGNEYTISIPVDIVGVDKSGFISASSKSYFPEIKFFTLKNISGATLVSDIDVSKKGNEDVETRWYKQGPLDINRRQSATLTLKFTPDKCFKYIGFTTSNNLDEKVSIHIKYSTISVTPLMYLDGEPEMCLGSTQTISYKTKSGYTINEPVYWYVKGDLQIVGNSHGPNVTIKSIGSSGGTVGYSSCSNNSPKGIESKITTRSSEEVKISGNTFVYSGNSSQYNLYNAKDVVSQSWSVDGGRLISDKNSRSVEIEADSFPAGAYDGLMIIRCTITDKCGITKTVSKNIKIRACSDCPNI